MQASVRDERGAVLVIVALVMSVLLTLSAGGIMLFSLYGSQREMQKAADQAALAGAAAMPVLNPGQTLSNLPMNTAYDLTDDVGLDVPLKGLSNVPDPRAVACAYGTRLLEADSAKLVEKFGVGPSGLPSSYCASSPWSDVRVNPSLNSLSTPLSQCVNTLTSQINSLTNQLLAGRNSLVGNLLALLGLGMTGAQVTALVDSTVARLNGILTSVQNLESLSPALLTPEMRVRVTDKVKPPLIGMVTGGDGVQMQVEATAKRRLKNAIVLPNTPALVNTDLNTALNATKPQVLSAMDAANTQLNNLMSALGVTGCQNLLSPSSSVYQDISDIYTPPSSAPYTGRDLITGATAAVTRAASQSGQTADDLAGEAFVVIRQGATPTTLSSLLGPVATQLGLSSTLQVLPIPALDVAMVAAHNLEDGNISN
ncbi:MAG TPA: hypothetical protein VHJ78_06770, partial [Actinomycetota bacterium]|nr:hypothetical protein [Actinomycetota bacterium]